MTKAQTIKRRNRILNIAVIVIDTIVFVRIIFNLALTLNGNWDDINAPMLMVLVSAALVGLFFALLNNIKYKGHPSYVLGAVIVLGFAALFLMYVLLAASFVSFVGV